MSFDRILVKLEYENPTGSMKDRMALAMVEAAEADGRLRPGGRTSGTWPHSGHSGSRFRDEVLKHGVVCRHMRAAPDAKEAISYQIPTFKLGGNLVHFAAFTQHISFFPTSSGVEKFKKELEVYETSKGTISFPLEKPIPYGLISKITKFRVKEVIHKGKKKKT